MSIVISYRCVYEYDNTSNVKKSSKNGTPISEVLLLLVVHMTFGLFSHLRVRNKQSRSNALSGPITACHFDNTICGVNW